MAPPLDQNDPIVQRINRYGPYGYVPELAPAVVFVVAYALLTIVHLVLTIRSRQWWLLVLVVGALLETCGNSLRLGGHFDSTATNAYIAMQCIVVFSPTFFAAIHFALLGKVLLLFGRRRTFVNPKWIIPFFLGLDVVSLVIQGVGASKAATNEINGFSPDQGGYIVVGGLALQVAGYILFDLLALDFAIHAWSKKTPSPTPDQYWTRELKIGLAMAMLSATLVLLRSVFRCAEMSIGWIGYVATTEWYYYVFDATPVTLAVLLLAIWHPSFYLPRHVVAARREDEEARGAGQTGQEVRRADSDQTAVSSVEIKDDKM